MQNNGLLGHYFPYFGGPGGHDVALTLAHGPNCFAKGQIGFHDWGFYATYEELDYGSSGLHHTCTPTRNYP